VTQSLPKGIKWTGRYCSDHFFQIAALRDGGTHRKMIVHADNGGPHVAKCVTEYMDHNSMKRTPHPPYSPDLAPSDFIGFGHVKHKLQGHEFTEEAELVSAISEIVNQIPTYTLVDDLTTG
jgi:transposase